MNRKSPKGKSGGNIQPRAFDPKVDKFYHPEGTPNLYLTEQQVCNALSSIDYDDNPAENAVRQLIEKIQEHHRNELLGAIDRVECMKSCKKLQDDFVSKFSVWAFHTRTSILFYEYFELDS